MRGEQWLEFLLFVGGDKKLSVLRGERQLPDQIAHVRRVETFGWVVNQEQIELHDLRLELGEHEVGDKSQSFGSAALMST